MHMNIVWIGFHEEGVQAFRETLENNNHIAAFITLDEIKLAERSAGSRAYLEYCEQYGVPCYMVSTIKGDEAYEIIQKHQPDLLVVLGWSEILPERLLALPGIGTVGAHASLLPHNRGSAPVNWALIHGEKETGNTMMWLDPQVDAGEIIDQVRFPITPYDTCKTLYDQVAASNALMMDRLLKQLKQGRKPVMPLVNETEEPILPRRRPKDGLINWKQDGSKVYDFIRALTDPYPGAFSYLQGQKILIWKAVLLPLTTEQEAGRIIGNAYGFSEGSCGILVGTETNAILITEIEDEKGIRYSGRSLHELNLKGIFQNE